MINKKDIKKVCIISPTRLGDVIFCTPLFRWLKAQLPEARVDIVLLSPLAEAVVQNSPYFDGMFRLKEISDLDRFANQYDLVIDIHDSDQVREIMSHFSCPALYYDSTRESNKHQVDKLYTFFCEQFGITEEAFDGYYELFPQKEQFNKIDKLLSQLDKKRDVLVGYHMGCHGLTKKKHRVFNRLNHRKAWPLKNFIELSQSLQKKYPHVRFVLTGTKAERELGMRFCRKIPNTINLVDRTSVLDLAALMHRVSLFVSNDTGTLHVACTHDIPVIALFGKENYVDNGPYPKNERRIVFYEPKISDIKVNDVLAAADHILESV